MQAIKRIGKLCLTSVAVVAMFAAFGLGWCAFIAEGAGKMDAATACLSMSVGLGAMAGGLLTALWTKYV